MTYQANIPTGLVNLNIDYLNIQGNFTTLNNVFGVDHTTFDNSTAQIGYHTVIHFIPNSTIITNPATNYPPTPPATTAGFGQLWCPQITDGFNTDEALYFQSGGGRITQLTSNIKILTGSNGATFLPGGLILQWGIVIQALAATDSGNVVLNTTGNNYKFGNNIFNVFTQLISSNGSLGVAGGNTLSILNTANINQFQWVFVGKPATFTGFYWWALGN